MFIQFGLCNIGKTGYILIRETIILQLRRSTHRLHTSSNLTKHAWRNYEEKMNEKNGGVIIKNKINKRVSV